MGNTFKSLAVAASLLAAAPDTPGQDQANEKATKTSAALTELLNALPPEFEAGKKKIAGDIDLTTDGDLSLSDATTIEKDMSLLAPRFPDVVRKVREAMNGVETVIAAEQVAALNETPEERKERKTRDELIKKANEILSSSKSVTYNSGDTASASLKISTNTRIFHVVGKQHKPKLGTNLKATANITVVGIGAGTKINYTLTPPENVPDGKKEVKSVRVILVNTENRPINMSGAIDDAFCIKVESGASQEFIMPPNSIGFTEKIDLILNIDLVEGDYPDTEFRAGLSTIEIIPATPAVIK